MDCFTSTPAKVSNTSSTSTSSTATTTGDSTPTVYALIACLLEPFSSRTVLPFSSVMMIYAVSRGLRNALEQHPLLPAEISATLHRVPFKTSHPPIAVPIDKLQALLSCLSTSWTEVSFSLCSSPTRTLPLQVCAASAAVKHRCRILKPLWIRPAFSLKSCLALRCSTHSHCARVVMA